MSKRVGGGGRCYEAAYKAFEHSTEATARLVHGVVSGTGRLTGERIGHAWVELHGGMLVYDATVGKDGILVPGAMYFKAGQAAETRHYTRDEARSKVLETGNYGPWHESTGAHRPRR